MKFQTGLILFIIFSFSFAVCAQDEQILARDIVTKSVNKYKAYTTTHVAFNYIMENRAETLKEEHKGEVYLKNGNFRLTIGDQTIITDQIKVWSYMKEANEVQVSKYIPAELEINPNEIFTMWDKGFLIRFVGEVMINNVLTNLVELTPENKNLSYYKVKLFIDKKTNSLTRIQTFYKNSGITLTFDITTVKPNITMSDALFKFDISKYPGIEVIDLTK